MNNNPIGIFDSGIGGVTVLKEIIKVLPKENYIFYSDSKNNPYGDKTQNEILEICDNIVKFLLNRNCKAIVIACNTASAKAVEYLRNKYKNIPFIAIEPAYKMVYDYSYDKETLVMATKGTIESEKFNLLYHKYDNHKTKLLPCVGLADLIEQGNYQKIKSYLNENLKEYKGKIKNVVLGCTHYPLIQDEIKKVLENDVIFFHGTPNLAKHLKVVLEENNMLGQNKTNIEFIDSQNIEEKKMRFEKYLNRDKASKKVLFATTNPAKINRYAEGLKMNNIDLLTIKDLDIELEVNECGKNALENAYIKAKAYYDATGITSIGMDNSLFFEDLPEDKQPGTHVRRVNGKTLNDEEMIEYYINLVKANGGKLTVRWDYGMVIYDEKGAREYIWNKSNFYMVPQRSDKMTPGYPLDSISIIPEFNKYLVELTPEEKRQNDISNHEEVIRFIIDNI